MQATVANASATAIRIGTATATPAIRVTCTVAATGGANFAQSTAILIDTGGNVPAIRNAGTIFTAAAVRPARATAILDRSGRLALVENSGAIAASGADAARNIAIDLIRAAIASRWKRRSSPAATR